MAMPPFTSPSVYQPSRCSDGPLVVVASPSMAASLIGCLGCRTGPIRSSVYFCDECCASVRRSMRRASTLSPAEMRRLERFTRMVGAEALEEIAARDEAMRRLDTILRAAPPVVEGIRDGR